MRTRLSRSRAAGLVGGGRGSRSCSRRGARAQEPTVSVDRRGRLAGSARRARRRLDGAALRRPARAAFARERVCASPEGSATEAEMRAWTAAAVAQQEQFLARLSSAGARIAAEYRYVRVVNGFSAQARSDLARAARARPRGRRRLSRCGSRIRRRPTSGRRRAALVRRRPRDPRPRRHAASPSRCSTRASTRRTRTCGGSVLSGVDVINPGSGGDRAAASDDPGPAGAPRDGARRDRHRLRRARTVCTASRPAPRSSRCASPAGSRTPRAGTAVYSRTDQILAGLEAAVDPNDDGDAHDAARIALDRRRRAVRGVLGRPARARDRRRRRTLDMLDDRPGRERRSRGTGLRQHRRPRRRARRRHRRVPPTAASRRRRSASTFGPGSGCCSRTRSRSAALRRRR